MPELLPELPRPGATDNVPGLDNTCDLGKDRRARFTSFFADKGAEDEGIEATGTAGCERDTIVGVTRGTAVEDTGKGMTGATCSGSLRLI